MTSETSPDTQMLLRLIEMMERRRTGLLPAAALATSALALAVSGATAWTVMRTPPTTPGASHGAVTAAPVPASPVMRSADVAATTPSSGPPAADTRVARADDGAIYAFDPGTGLAFRFEPGQAGPTQIPGDALPADVAARLRAGDGRADETIDMDALDAQTDRARALLAAQGTDQSRPPLNDILTDPAVTAEVVASLDQAEGVLRPGSDGDREPVIYAFYDPQCPYCHAAFEDLDGRHAVKWMPLSTLGPRSDELHAHILGPATLDESRLEGGETVPRARLDDDPERGERFAAVMRDEARPPAGELADAQSFVLGENAELFRLLSQGAEEMRAVPTFLIREPDGTAVWLRGFDEDTGDEIADIIAGEDAT